MNPWSNIQRHEQANPSVHYHGYTKSKTSVFPLQSPWGASHFCLVPMGTSSWTNHLYESFFAGCIPVILSFLSKFWLCQELLLSLSLCQVEGLLDSSCIKTQSWKWIWISRWQLWSSLSRGYQLGRILNQMAHGWCGHGPLLLPAVNT